MKKVNSKQSFWRRFRQSHLFWFNVFGVVPFCIFIMQATITGSALLWLWALMLAPVAVTTIALDVYTLVRAYRR